MNPNVYTRRDFIRTGMLGAALTWSIPAFLLKTADSLHAASDGALTQQPTGKDSSILVILQLSGGNDGLNTVIPIGDDDYYKARPKIAIPAASALKISDTVGLHPAMTDLQTLYDLGNLAILQATGYPNPNRSHFRSMEIWHTASDSDRTEAYGWLGRYFDNACVGCDPTVGVALGHQAPEAFSSHHPAQGITIENIAQYRLPKDVEALYADHPEMMDSSDDSSSGSSIQSLSGGASHVGISPLDFLERVELDVEVSSKKIRDINATTKNQATYPAGKLAQDLSLVGRLIAGRLPTRVFYVSFGGFDTHANQAPTQNRLLGELSSALRAFVTDLQKQGNFNRTTILAFSEFGRRVKENGSGGTDHGSGAPLFVCGGGVKGGIYGALPSLEAKNLLNGDVRFSTDFRSVYATLLEKSLRVPSAPILGRNFPLLSFT